MSVIDLPRRAPEDDPLILALPAARRLARLIAKHLGVRAPDVLEDCEQAGVLALIEVSPRHDRTRGDLFRYAWKRIAGAVTDLVCSQSPVDRAGRKAALEAMEEFRDATDPFAVADDPFAVDDEGDTAELKDYCRWVTFTRLTAETGERLRMPGADLLLVRARAFRALVNQLGELNEQERRYIELRHMLGLSWDDVANEMGVERKYAQRIDDGIRARLRRGLRLQGVDEPPPSER
jgi:RNA polymerase sigma factor (sigma-70 family)